MDDAIAPRFRKGRLNPPEAAEYLSEVHGTPIAHATLNKLRSVGGGPKFEKFGRAVLYPRASLDEWVSQKLGQPRVSTAGR